jgi:hypothetical protein
MPQQVGYLRGTIQSAPSGFIGFDADSKLSYTTARDFYNRGFRFCLRYISLSSTEDSADLDYYEANEILAAGLALMPVQHVRYAGWSPNGNLGTIDGENARDNAFYVGFPAHVNVWLDLEGVAPGTPAQDVIDYCNNWYDAVSAWGFVPGLYVGYDPGLDSKQLYWNLKFQHYWHSLNSSTSPVDVRGYQMIQSQGSSIDGIAYDDDKTQHDNNGGSVRWIKR